MEVVLAIAILSVAIAASTAGLSLAASARSDSNARNLAAEIANEVLQKAEAFGCGLPPDYNGVSAAERLAACDYDPDDINEGAALADVDFTIGREGVTFGVTVRMRWHSTHQPPPSAYFTSTSECRRRALWAHGFGRGNPALSPPDHPTEPTLLSRTITVTPASGGAVVLRSTEAVLSDLADPHHSGLVLRDPSGSANTKVTLTQLRSNVNQYNITLHTDSSGCVWLPYLEYASSVTYQAGNSSYNLCNEMDNTWYRSTDRRRICHEYSDL